MPNPGFWGISSATGDLVDNHDIVQVRRRPTRARARASMCIPRASMCIQLAHARASNPPTRARAQFVVRSLHGVDDPEKDYDAWEAVRAAQLMAC